MFGENMEHLTPSAGQAYFIPANPAQVVLSSSVKSMYIRYKNSLSSQQFKDGELLLVQNKSGSYEWTFVEGFFKQNHDLRLYSCTLSHKEACFIVKNSVLFIQDDDSRLSNFGLLSRVDQPSNWEEAAENIDLVDRHLSSKRAVIIYHVDEMGNKFINDVKTADYSRAKKDVSIQLENQRNMRRFCNREGPNGEGPSDLHSRICPGYVKTISCLLEPTFLSSSCQQILISSSSSDVLSVTDSPDAEESPSPPIKQHRKHSTAYYFMRFTFYPSKHLAAEQHRHDLGYARKEKQPENFTTASQPPRRGRWTIKAFERVLDFCMRRKRRSCTSGEIPGSSSGDINAHLKLEEGEETQSISTYEKNNRRCNKISDINLDHFSYEVSTRGSIIPSLISSNDISPLILAPAAITSAH